MQNTAVALALACLALTACEQGSEDDADATEPTSADPSVPTPGDPSSPSVPNVAEPGGQGGSSADPVQPPPADPSPPAGSGGSPSAASLCALALFCDDFEDDPEGSPPAAPWESQPNGATVLISRDRAFSGDQSVYVETTAGAYKQGYFSLQGEPVFPAAGAEMYGRMMMWLEATPQGSVHWTFIQGEGPSADGSYTALYRYGGQHEGRLMANYETQGLSTDCWDHSATVMPTQTWTCLEWRFNVATNEMQFWMDGADVEDIHTTGRGEGCVGQDLSGAWLAPTAFERIRLGWERYQESDERRVYIDDVVIDSQRVGCP